MRLQNTSRYPTQEVRELVEFATKGIRLTRVAVHVKNHRGSIRGMAYNGVPYISSRHDQKTVDRLVTIGIGTAFPATNMRDNRRWVEVSEEEYRSLSEQEQRGIRHWSYSDGRHRYQRPVLDRHPYGGKRSPLIEMADWREGLVAVAAHEARHVYQAQRGKPASEVDAERFAAKRLAEYRTR